MKRKTNKKTIEYYGTGFKINLVNAPMIKFQNEWILDIDFQEIDNVIFEILAHKKIPITGNELKFIRLHSGMNKTTFGKRFYVTHACVHKWEKCADKPTNMLWGTEKDIRLFILNSGKLSGAKFQKAYESFQDMPTAKRAKPIEVDARTLVCA